MEVNCVWWIGGWWRAWEGLGGRQLGGSSFATICMHLFGGSAVECLCVPIQCMDAIAKLFELGWHVDEARDRSKMGECGRGCWLRRGSCGQGGMRASTAYSRVPQWWLHRTRRFQDPSCRLCAPANLPSTHPTVCYKDTLHHLPLSHSSLSLFTTSTT